MRGYVKSSPTFFRLILIAMSFGGALLLILAYCIPAPLQEQGSIAVVPNPVKSAWFLLWIQELVGYDKRLIYGVALLALIGLALPWISGYRCNHAGWLRKGNRLAGGLSLVTFVTIVILTVIAMLFRGENWAFMLPF